MDFEMNENPMALGNKALSPPRAPSQTQYKSKSKGSLAASTFSSSTRSKKLVSQSTTLRAMSSRLMMGPNARSHRRLTDFFDDPTTRLTFSRVVATHGDRYVMVVAPGSNF